MSRSTPGHDMDSSSYSRQNGNLRSPPSQRATMENIKSVHDNPFYKNFGIRHNIPSSSRSSYSSENLERKRLSSNGRTSSLDEDDDIGEYKPGSGYVHKLLDKFTSLTAKSDKGFGSLKRSSSVDEISGENESTNAKPSIAADEASHTIVNTTFEKPSLLSSAKFSPKARSVENLNHAHKKPHHLAVSLRHVETKWDKEKQSLPPKSPRDSHIVAPDVELARDDIIIIEKTPPVPPLKGLDDDESESDDGTPRLLSHREMLPKDELPKPNTVLNVRSIFENVSSNTFGSGLHTRRLKSDGTPLSPSSPTVVSPVSTETAQVFSNDSGSNRVSIRSPSPVTSPRLSSTDTHAKPVLLPSNVTVSKSFDYSSNSHFSRPEDKLTTPSSLNVSVTSHSKPLASSRESTPRLDDNVLHSSDSKSLSGLTGIRTSNFERSNDSSRSGDILRPTPSPRSTASVKPTIPSRPSAPVKPVPLSAPASAATSYRKSSPVVPVAPFKDKPEDNKDDGQPVMIFNKSKLSPRRDKPQRIKDYAPIKDTSSKLDNEEPAKEKDKILPKESRNIFKREENSKSTQETNNKILSQRRKQIEPGNKAVDKVTSDQNKIVHGKEQTTIEIRRSSRPPQEKEQSEEKSRKVEKEVELKRVTPQAATRSAISSKSKSLAPEPPKPQSMTYISSSENSESDSTPPETPRTRPEEVSNRAPSNRISLEDSVPDTPRGKKPDRDSLLGAIVNDKSTVSQAKTVDEDTIDGKDQPVKGIPSIIAQRLRQQSSSPSQLAEDVVSSTAENEIPIKSKIQDSDSNTSNGVFSPRKRLTPPATFNSSTPAPSNNTNKDSLSSEIENEIAAVRKKMEVNRSKSGGPAQIFDSSQLAKKRKENQRARAAAQGLVPPLDLSSITDGKAKDYQPKPKEIKPCNIVFVGENAKTARSLLAKKRNVKVKIHFNDTKTETFEYPSEGLALEKYLELHPHEASDMLVLEDFGGGANGESSDDVETVDIIEMPVTPRGNSDEDLLKSNPALSASGSLQSYRGRFQQEYEFGRVLQEQEQPKPVVEQPAADPDSMMLRPAEEDVSNTWSTSSSSDLLF